MSIDYRLGFILAILLAIGCAGSGGNTPVEPGFPEQSVPVSLQSEDTTGTNRYMWGLWEVKVDPENQSVVVTPKRVADMHLNAVKFLEVAPCTDCLTIGNFDFSIPGELSVDVTLRHPFEGNLNFTAFDVRGIFITDGDYNFACFKKCAWGEDLPWVLNADGFTELFSQHQWPVYESPILRYFPGKFANSDDLSANVNPFIAYARDAPRRMFLPASEETRTIRIRLPGGPFEFGYAVDACWAKPDGTVTDPVTDFPAEANCPEAYRISVSIGEEIGTVKGSFAPIQIEVYDHQGLDTIQYVTADIDGVTDPKTLTFSTVTGEESYLFTGKLENTSCEDEGEYPLIAYVSDTEDDPYLDFEGAKHIIRFFLPDIDDYIPIALAGAWPLPQIIHEPVQFWDNGSYDLDGGAITKYEWDWDNDGLYDDEGEEIFHAFDTPGIHKVQLRVTDDEGTSGTLEEPLEIEVKTGLGWARTWGSNGGDSALGVAVDDSGDVYVTGIYIGLTDFDPGPGVEERHSAWPGLNPGCSIFLSKFDKNGNFLWVRTGGGDYIDYADAVAVDDFGNVYVAGHFVFDLRFESDPDEEVFYFNGDLDCFLCKYTSEGEFQWARTWGGDGKDRAYNIIVDGMGDIYVCGGYEETVDFDPGPDSDWHTSNGGWDAYLSKFDSSGDFIWAGTWGDDLVDFESYEYAQGVTTDSDGNVFVTGKYQGTVDFDPGPEIEERETIDKYDVFLSKFDSNCEFQWVRVWDGEFSLEVTVDIPGNIYVIGCFEDTCDFDPGPDEDWHTYHVGHDGFLSKYDTEGEFYWARTWGSNQTVYWPLEGGHGVATDELGDVYVTGLFYGTCDFDPGPGIEEHSSNNNGDAFLSKFDSDGEFQWVGTWGGPEFDYADYGHDVAVGPTGFVYSAGRFLQTVDFDPGPGFDWHAAVGFGDAFLTRFPPDGNW